MDENCLNFRPQAEADVQQEAFVKPLSGRSAYSRFSMADVHLFHLSHHPHKLEDKHGVFLKSLLFFFFFLNLNYMSKIQV